MRVARCQLSVLLKVESTELSIKVPCARASATGCFPGTGPSRPSGGIPAALGAAMPPAPG